ncbi:MAG TPA: ATP-binding protein, partial [Dissulfurispiraceae bacterium]|nr:ATP-binding protein [Dissulfurispiraceae bacterium]
GLLSLFESSMKTSLCPHVMTGSPQGVLEDLFTDNSFRGQAERMFLEPLPEDVAYSLFKSCCDKLEMKGDKKIVLKFLRVLDGNPLYIRNMVRTLWKQQRRDITERDLWETYSFEVSEGEAAFYLSSIMGEFIRDAGQRRIGIELLMHSVKSNCGFHDTERLAKILDVPESSVISVLDALRLAGLIQGGDKKRDLKDNVLRDFIHSLYMREVDGIRTQRMRELIEARYSSGSGHVLSSFEMVIPVASDAELVAAKAMEQIGRNINLAPDVINHLQLALIESCINAMEHSGNHDQKVFLKFTVSTERIEIIIESPGKFFDTEAVEGRTVEEKLRSEDKRGWGLKLMRTIMDEVRVERIGEKTRVSLIKNINPDDVVDPAPSRP